MTFYRHQDVVTPDGYSGFVELCGSDWVLVWLSNVHWERSKRYQYYRKDDERWTSKN